MNTLQVICEKGAGASDDEFFNLWVTLMQFDAPHGEFNFWLSDIRENLSNLGGVELLNHALVWAWMNPYFILEVH